MGMFNKKKKSKKIPQNSKLYAILRGIDETEIAKARKMQGFDQVIKIESGVTKIETVKLKDQIK